MGIMRRTTFDKILGWAGASLGIALLAVGGLLLWGSAYIHNTVQGQLAAQQIYFPPAAAFAHPKAGTEITPSMIPSVSQYAGQELLTGPQAEVYANDFIAVHLSEMPYGGVYYKVSSAARSAKPGSPQATQLAGLESTVFQGTTLRGLLLEAYGFWEFGNIAFWAAIASFVLAGVMALLTGFGIWHARRTPAEIELIKTQSKAA